MKIGQNLVDDKWKGTHIRFDEKLKEDDRTVFNENVKECDKCDFIKKDRADMIMTIVTYKRLGHPDEIAHHEYLCLNCSLNKYS